MLTVCNTLYLNSEYARALQLLDTHLPQSDAASPNIPVLLLTAQCFAALAQWDEVEAAVGQPLDAAVAAGDGGLSALTASLPDAPVRGEDVNVSTNPSTFSSVHSLTSRCVRGCPTAAST